MISETVFFFNIASECVVFLYTNTLYIIWTLSVVIVQPAAQQFAPHDNKYFRLHFATTPREVTRVKTNFKSQNAIKET